MKNYLNVISAKLKMMTNKVEEVKGYYYDFLTIRKIMPDIIKTITTLVIAAESNRLIIENLINELDKNDISSSKEKNNNENWIN